jgi:hypothetical protein
VDQQAGAKGARADLIERTCLSRLDRFRILSVPFSTFFYWRNPPVSGRSVRRAWLTDVICQIHSASRQTYGLRRIRAELADAYG